MSQKGKYTQNGHSESALEIYDKVVRPTEGDKFLEETNLGLGNYSKKLYWQQIGEFKDHLYGEAAFGGGKNVERALADVRFELAREAWDELDEDEREEALEKCNGSRRRWFRERGDELLEAELPSEKEIKELMLAYDQNPRDLELRAYYRELALELVLDEHTRVSGELTSAFGRMIRARHEGSRSIGAHLIDSVTNRVKEIKGDRKKEKKKRLGLS